MEFGLEPAEANFADWLKKKYNVTAEEFLGEDDMEELRGRYKRELEEVSEGKEDETSGEENRNEEHYSKIKDKITEIDTSK